MRDSRGCLCGQAMRAISLGGPLSLVEVSVVVRLEDVAQAEGQALLSGLMPV